MRRRYEEENQDLDLAPMLAMMVTLIPILLLSFSFLQVSVISAALPQPTDTQQKNPVIKPMLKIVMGKSGKSILKVQKGKITLKKMSSSLDPAELKSKIQGLSNSFPKMDKAELWPSENVSYEDVVKVMDAVRGIPNNSGEAGAKKPHFSDIIFAGIFEG